MFARVCLGQKGGFWGVLRFVIVVWGKRGARVSLYCPGYAGVAIHRRDPATDRHGSFDLLRLRPGPVHPSLVNLVSRSSPRVTILMAALAWTPARHSARQPRTPGLSDPPASASPELGLQAQATVPGCSLRCLRSPSALERLLGAAGGAAGTGSRI